MLRWRNWLLMAEPDPLREDQTACLKRIESCLLGFVEQEELGSLMESVVLSARMVLLDRPMHQSSLEREDGREKHLRGQYFSWPVGV